MTTAPATRKSALPHQCVPSNIGHALQWGYRTFANSSDSPLLDAEILLAHTIKKNKAFLYAHPEKTLSPAQARAFARYVQKRRQRYPVAYLTRKKAFYGSLFYVDERVLIPRPLTETMVSEASALIKRHRLKTAADIGTGSGCIAISVKVIHPSLTMYATDISKEALTVAKKNARARATDLVFLHGDLLDPVRHKKIDLVLANLPYLEKNIYDASPAVHYEPRQALIAKNKGLSYYINAIRQCSALPWKPKFLIFEIMTHQARSVAAACAPLLPKNIETIGASGDGAHRFLKISL